MNPRIPFGSPISAVCAQMIATCAIDPLVIHIFAPFNTQESPSALAVVIIPPGFDPKSGSVSPKHPMASPLASLGSQSSFCSSLPKAKIGYMTSAPCTDANDRTPESPRSSSCMISP